MNNMESRGSNSVLYKRQSLDRLKAQLELERSTFEAQWRDNSDFILPRRSRFFVSDANKGDRRNLKIIDSTATLSARTLSSGMMAGVTSPARPWFRLSIPSQDLAERESVKAWLHEVTQRMTTVFLRSNLYNVLPIIYGDMGVFGTSAILMEEDFNSVVRFYPFPIGSYMIANDKNLRVNVFVREFRMTVRQVVSKFGVDPSMPGKIIWDNISGSVKSLWNSDNKEAWVDIVHAIVPNDDYNPSRIESRYKKYTSVYYETGSSGYNSQGNYYSGTGKAKFLSEKGYDFFPVLCPRWSLSGEDVYATDCPGMSAIGDIKQLQTGEKRALQAVEKMVNPPMMGPTSLKNATASILPGDITYIDIREGLQGFRPVHEINFDITALEQKQEVVRGRVKRAFYEDLFLMLSTTDRRQITATEIEERHSEKLLALGPVLEQLNQDLLDPLIDNTFYLMLEQDLIPPAPKEIEGQDLKVDYISIMAQAQKLVGLGGIERFVGFASQIASQAPSILDKIDGDQIIDIYSDLTSIPPGIVRSDEVVAGIREQRAQSEMQAQRLQQAQQAAVAAKDLSETDTTGENALTQIFNQG